MVRVIYIERDLGMQFVGRNLYLAFHSFPSFKHSIVKSKFLLACFRDSGKQNFDICDLICDNFASLSHNEQCRRPPVQPSYIHNPSET